MKYIYSIVLFFLSTALYGDLAVNWGGDYVTTDQDSVGLNAGHVPFNLETLRNPMVGEGYDGLSPRFYAGLVTVGNSLVDVWNVDQDSSVGDSLRFRVPSPETSEGGAALYLWVKNGFLNDLATEESLFLSSSSAFSFEGRRFGAAIFSQVRFIFSTADNQYFISDSMGPIPADWGGVSLDDPTGVDWFEYAPATDLLEIGPIAEPTFGDVSAVGVYLKMERSRDGETSMTSALKEFKVSLSIEENSGDFSACLDSVDPSHYSALAVPNQDGKLTYQAYNSQGDTLPDFSHCGYGGGGKAIPNVPVVYTIDGPSGGDDRALIQEAIDSVALLTPDENGIRGAILVSKGTYYIGGTIRLHASGVVLRGEGSDELTGTVLVATGTSQHTLIEIAGSGGRGEDSSTRVDIADDYVPSGSYSFNVINASQFSPGDTIIVRRRSTAAWISALGMHQIPPRSDGGLVTQWEAGSYDLLFDRVITKIVGDTITVDAPLTNAIQSEYGGGYIYRYDFPGRIENVGVEDMAGVSEYDDSITEFSSAAGKVIQSDENHGWRFISLNRVQNAWVRGVSSRHFGFGCVDILDDAKWVTVEDCAFYEPVSKITGGRRYPFDISGHLSLVIHCFAEEGRHDFAINGGQTPGPNAFVNCRSVRSYSTSEPHQRWSVGGLWDNVSVEGPSGWMMASNRGNAGTGHGWAGAQMVFWNCRAAVIGVLQPPTAQNFAIGVAPPAVSNPGLVQSAVNTMNSQSGMSLPADSPFWGTGYKESPDQMVYPRSLYFKQLHDRLGASNETFGFDGWLAREGVPEIGQSEDSDSDGISNLIEYYVGSDPLLSDSENAYRFTIDGNEIIFSYDRSLLSIDVFGLLEYSTDMENWEEAVLAGGSQSLNTSSAYRCEVKIPIIGATPKFFRLRVTR